jgi:hypothetical protein
LFIAPIAFATPVMADVIASVDLTVCAAADKGVGAVSGHSEHCANRGTGHGSGAGRGGGGGGGGGYLQSQRDGLQLAAHGVELLDVLARAHKVFCELLHDFL